MATHSNLANNLLASSCDSRRPIICFATFHLRSSSWPSVNSPSAKLVLSDLTGPRQEFEVGYVSPLPICNDRWQRRTTLWHNLTSPRTATTATSEAFGPA